MAASGFLGWHGRSASRGAAAEGPSLASLLQQALAAHEVERAELHALREEVSRLRATASAATAEKGGCGSGGAKSGDHLDILVQVHDSGAELEPPTLLSSPAGGGQGGAEPPPPQGGAAEAGRELLAAGGASQELQKMRTQPSMESRNSSATTRTLRSGHSGHQSAIAVLQDQSSSKVFEVILERMSLVLISANIVMLWMQLQYVGHEAGVELHLAEPRTWPPLGSTFRTIEHVFNVLFLVELVSRLLLSRSRFFYKDGAVEKFNVFDMFLVLATSLDLYLIEPMTDASKVNLTIFRPLRFVRLIRTLRVAQTLKFFITLRVMINATIASFGALFWSMILLLVVMLMAALCLCQSLQDSLEPGPAISAGTRDWIFQYYGTPLRAIWTVFELTFSGCWPSYARTLIEEVSNWYSLFFFVYIILVVFALFRVVTALFLKDTMALAAKDAEVAVQQKMHQKEQMARSLLDFFEAADTSGDGFLTKEEFDDILRNEKVKTWLSLMELDLHETEELFAILADGDGLVSFDEFTKGVLQMKGAARSEDVMAIKHNCKHLAKEVGGVQQAIADLTRLVQEIQTGIPVCI